jgi:phosphoglycerol transferase MdoB-like AlkP superfamily enzyme
VFVVFLLLFFLFLFVCLFCFVLLFQTHYRDNNAVETTNKKHNFLVKKYSLNFMFNLNGQGHSWFEVKFESLFNYNIMSILPYAFKRMTQIH